MVAKARRNSRGQHYSKNMPQPITQQIPQYWLLKSEPSCYSFDNLAQLKQDYWNGIRNYQARNFLRTMQVGDLCLFYHSSTHPAGVAGIVRVVAVNLPDNLQFDPNSQYYDPKASQDNPRWTMVEVEAVQKLPEFISLAQIRVLPEWETSPLTQKGSRLSVMPVTAPQFNSVLKVAGLSEHVFSRHIFSSSV